MKPCETLSKLVELCKTIPEELEEEIELLDDHIPSYEDFLELLRKAKPADGSLVFNIYVPAQYGTNCISLEAMKWFIKTRLYQWDPTLERRVLVIWDTRGFNIWNWRLQLKSGNYILRVNLEDAFDGYDE